MRVRIVSPSLPGNQVTARRWARLLRELDHAVVVDSALHRGDEDVLIALHARRSHRAILAWHRRHPDRPLIVAMTGTDLYRDLPECERSRESLERADRIIVLQQAGLHALPEPVRDRGRVVVQSVAHPRPPREPVEDAFRACLLAYLRPVKAPLVAAEAVRGLPETSRVEVVHAGGILDKAYGRRVEREAARNPRYRWVGERSSEEALALLASSHILLVTSRMEGGANVVCEAIALGVPVLSTDIPGSTGLLGDDHPGLFGVDEPEALGRLLRRAETDVAFYRDLERRSQRLAPLVEPSQEQESLARLLAEVAHPDTRPTRS